MTRTDPTMTAQLRRAFQASLRGRFAQLKLRVVQFLVQDDPLGIAANAFCATGPGGGVDPSCGARADIHDDIAAALPKATQVQLQKIRALNPGGADRGVLKVPKAISDEHANQLGQKLGIKVVRVYAPGAHRTPPPAPAPTVESTKERAGRLAYWHADIDKQLHLSDEAKSQYKLAFSRVLTAMPDHAASLVDQNLREVKWFADTAALTESFSAGAKQTVNGWYRPFTRTAALDGETVKENAPAIGPGTIRNVHGTYAHELTHAIDASTFGVGKYSSTKEWQTAFNKEILGEARLSRYAQTDPAEGFAEFGRLLYGTDNSQVVAEAMFPRCYKFFTDNKLWQHKH